MANSTLQYQLVNILGGILPPVLKDRICSLLSPKQVIPEIDHHVQEILQTSLQDDIAGLSELTG